MIHISIRIIMLKLIKYMPCARMAEILKNNETDYLKNNLKTIIVEIIASMI